MSYLIALCAFCLIGSPHAELSETQATQLGELSTQLAVAQQQQDLTKVTSIVDQMTELLGDQAGLPETADRWRMLPRFERAIPKQLENEGYDALLMHLEEERWWFVGQDPTTLPAPLREVSNALAAAVLATQHGPPHLQTRFLTLAEDSADYLLWAQTQAGTGVFPFPAVRNGRSASFRAAEREFRQAEQLGLLTTIIRNGWAHSDVGSGGLQFDNGLAGRSLIALYHLTVNQRYLEGALQAADWSLEQPTVPNWNYNAFSVTLLAEVYQLTSDTRYLEAMKSKLIYGVLPGQLRQGELVGRWFDPHNARPEYHFILVGSLVAAMAAIPNSDPFAPQLREALRLGLIARNQEFSNRVTSPNGALENLLLLRRLPTDVRQEIDRCCFAELATSSLIRFAVDQFAEGRPAVGALPWALVLRELGDRR